MSQSELFIGRRQLIDEICGSKPATTSLYTVMGPPGVGKTTLLSQLVAAIADQSGIVVRIGLQSFRSGGLGPNEDTGAMILQRSFDQFCDLTLGIYRQLGANRDRKFTERVRAAKRNPVAVAHPSVTQTTLIVENSDNVTVEGSLNAGLDDLEAAIHQLAHDFTINAAELISLAADRAPGKRLYVLMDEFDTVADDILASWVLTLIRHLRDVVVVVTGRPQMRIPSGSIRRVLSNFTRTESRRFLAARCGPDIASSLCDRTFAFTGGNPQALDIVADLILRSGEGRTSALLRSWTESGTNLSNSERLSELVDALLDTGPNAISREILDVLVVVRRFDERLLTEMLELDTSQIDPDQVYRTVAQLPFVEPSTTSGGESDGYRVHEFVRGILLQEMKSYAPARFARLHSSALAHYREQIEEVKTKLFAEDPFFEAVRYKAVRWRRLYTEWLYHLGHVASPEDRAMARLLFADVYFDAFWWWGYYAPLTFGDDLLREWELVCQDDDDWALLTGLTRVAHLFPRGWGTRYVDNPVWREITGALLWVRDLGRLDTIDPGTSDPSLRHLRAVVSLYLGEAAQSGGEGAAVADKWYADAQEMFDTDMGRDWTRFQRAELWSEMHEHELAIGLLTGVEDRARARGDHELLGRVATFSAFRELEHGLFTQATAHIVLANLHAFVFHVRQTAAPDEYSTKFQSEMVWRANEVLTTIARTADESAWTDVVSTATGLLAPLRHYAGQSAKVPDGERHVVVDALVQFLPPLPSAEDMHDPVSEYVTLTRWAKANMSDQLALPMSPATRGHVDG